MGWPFYAAVSMYSGLFFGFRETASGSGPAEVEQPLVSGKFVSTGYSQFNLSSYRKHMEKTVATKISES